MADDLEMQQRRLRTKKALEELQNMRGMGTELVTVIIPPDRLISDVRGQLGQEAAQAANIKSKLTRKHVGDAIESAISVLNRYKNAGEYGIEKNRVEERSCGEMKTMCREETKEPEKEVGKARNKKIATLRETH